MGHIVFEWTIAIAVLVAFITNIIFLILIYRILKPLISKLHATSDRINSLLDEIYGIISDNRDRINAIVSESQPFVRDIMIKTNDISGAVRGIINQVHGIISDNRETISNAISESKPLVVGILTKTNQIATTVHGILSRTSDIAVAVHDMVLALKNEINNLDSIVKDVSDKVGETTSILHRRIIEPIATKANDITDLARAQVVEIATLLHDIALTLRNRVERLDEIVRCTIDKIDSTTATVRRQVIEPVREINYIGVAIKRAISTLLNRDGKAVG